MGVNVLRRSSGSFPADARAWDVWDVFYAIMLGARKVGGEVRALVGSEFPEVEGIEGRLAYLRLAMRRTPLEEEAEFALFLATGIPDWDGRRAADEFLDEHFGEWKEGPWGSW